MKNVDRMIARARSLLCSLVDALSGNEDGFLDALGVDPQDYAQERPDGTIGYDFLKALCDTAVEDWGGYEEEEQHTSSKMTEYPPEDTGPLPEAKPAEKPKKKRYRAADLFGWG